MRVRDPGWKNSDPGWKKLDPRFLINIPDPQHCYEGKKDQYFIFLIRNSISIQKFVKESPDPAK
jgi:hypothetical protein